MKGSSHQGIYARYFSLELFWEYETGLLTIRVLTVESTREKFNYFLLLQ